MKKLLLTLAFFTVCTNSFAQPVPNWTETFTAGLDYYYSQGTTVTLENQTLKVIGKKNTISGQSLAIVWYDLNGNIINTFLSGPVSNATVVDYVFDAANNLYLLMNAPVVGGMQKIVLQKYSHDGNLIWTQETEDASDVLNESMSLGITTGNTVFVNGYKLYDFSGDSWGAQIPYLYAFDSNGNPLWQRQFVNNGVSNTFRSTILVNNDTAYMFFYDNTLAKIDSANTMTTFTTGSIGATLNLQLAENNNDLLFTAATGKYKITKADNNGTPIWSFDYGTFLPNNVLADEIKAVTQDSNGNIYVTGRHYGHDYGTPSYTNGDILTVKLDADGNLIWENRYQYGVNNCDIGHSITLKNGFIYVGGESQRLGVSTDYDYLTLKIDAATGQTDQVYRYNGPENGNDEVTSMCVLDNGNYALTGVVYQNGKYDWNTQFFTDTALAIPDNADTNAIEVAPNPVSNGGFIMVGGNKDYNYKLISAIGQLVQSGKLDAVSNHKILVENAKAGLYLLELDNEEGQTIKKIIVK